MSKKATNDALRLMYTNNLMEALTAFGEEVLRVGSNEIAIPVVDAEGEDSFVTFTVKVPTGSRDGDAYDGYSMAQDYAMRQEEKKAKAEKAAAEKARKIARDEKMRKQKAAAKAAREGKGE
jgi:flagellar biosynthesis/type III secretory pathway protein FliH